MKQALLFLLLTLPVLAQVSFTGTDYVQNFDGMGTGGAAPTGWEFYGALGGSSTTWTTTIPASGIGGGTLNATLTASTTFASSSNTAGWNFALATSPTDRALGTSPTSGQGVVLQLRLTNDTGSAINAIRVGFDTRLFTEAVNHLPGYWLFYSVDNGTTWTNASTLNPTAATVPSTVGVTNTPITLISLVAPWPAGGQLRLRWVDDNGDTSPDQIYGLDNVTIGVPIGQPPTVSLTAPASNTVFLSGDAISLAATASDTDGSITKVGFYQGNTLLGEDSTAPYEFVWNGAAAGTYSVTARATDNEANVTTSTAATIYVNTTAGSGTLTRGPYLNQANQNSIIIRWRSSQPVVGRVRVGSALGSLTSSVDEVTPTTEHVVQLTGLTPYTRYYYSIGSAADTLAGGDAEHTFRTSPIPGTATDTRIWVLGDAGRANADQTAVRDAYYTWTSTRTPDLCLMLGDNAYNSGTDSEYQAAVFNMYPTMLRKMPLWSCLGNHDANNGSTSSTAVFPYFDMFTFPTAGECGGVASGTERYFSFDYGNIHIINLDSQTSSRATIESTGSDGAMAAWLRNDLAGITATWIIAIFHHPPYSKGSHDSDVESQLVQMRERFTPILEAGGVDLVLTGHSHSYERSFFIDGHTGLSSTFNASHKKQPGNGRPAGDGAYIKPLTGPRDHFGAVYTLTGSAGSADGGTLNHPAMFVSYNTLGSFNLDINGNTLNATYIESDGDLADTFTIIKQGAADSDGDGVADAFELAHGMNRFSNADALLDTDQDGNNARAEYLFGLNPAASDRFGWTTTREISGDVVVAFPTLPQRTYRVFWSTDLTTWTPGSAVITGDGTNKSWTDSPGSSTRRFYRVEVSPGP
ncbi:MAG: metallophosphoesterase [Verrucomicrobiaceae bacterium]|nr:metallophosphoesterase [Verrucomicrobiaceae bacterium]